MSFESNRVVGWCTDDQTTGAWWIMADGSKLSAGSRNRNYILIFLQHQAEKRGTSHLIVCLRYAVRSAVNDFLKAIYVWLDSKENKRGNGKIK